MTTALDTIRYHPGIAGEEVAELVDSLEQEAHTLREQVEKLTEAYDQCGRTVQDYGRTITQTESRLREVATHCANVEQELAALAEQNEKLRETLIAISIAWSSNEIYSQHFFNEALSLPNLASPVLNKYRAEGMRMAGDFVESPIGRKLESLNDGPRQLAEGIRARAGDLEKNDAL